MFGVPFEFTIKKNRKFIAISAIVTIISVTILLFSGFFVCQDIYLRKYPSILYESFPSKEFVYYNITNENLFLGFRIETSSGVFYSNTTDYHF